MTTTATFSWLLVLPLLGSPLVYLAGRWNAKARQRAFGLARWLCLAFFLVSFIPLTGIGLVVLREGSATLTLGGQTLRMDGIGLLAAGTVLALGTLVTIFSFHYIRGDQDEEKYYALLLASCFAMIGLACATDLFNLWIWFEAMAITTYLLVAFHHEQPSSLEAAFKYLVQSAIGSLFVLIGIGLVLAQAGTLDLTALRGAMANAGAMGLAAGGLFVVGFGVKVALVPLHTWLPDAHSQAPSGISAMLSGVVIESGLIALLRALGALSGLTPAWGALLLGFGALNMLAGNLLALRQTEVKRMLAYSSVAQVGYMLVGFGIALAYGIADGAAGAFFHFFNHAMMKGLAFLGAGSLLYALHLARGDHHPLVLDDLNGASRRYPTTAFALSIALLALGGLPPLSGFMSKWQIFLAGGEARSTPLLWLMIFAGLNSVLSLAYYAPLVNRLYRREPSEAVKEGKPVAALMALPLLILVLVVVALGFWPAPAAQLTGPAANALLAAFGLR